MHRYFSIPRNLTARRSMKIKKIHFKCRFIIVVGLWKVTLLTIKCFENLFDFTRNENGFHPLSKHSLRNYSCLTSPWILPLKEARSGQQESILSYFLSWTKFSYSQHSKGNWAIFIAFKCESKENRLYLLCYCNKDRTLLISFQKDNSFKTDIIKNYHLIEEMKWNIRISKKCETMIKGWPTLRFGRWSEQKNETWWIFFQADEKNDWCDMKCKSVLQKICWLMRKKVQVALINDFHQSFC